MANTYGRTRFVGRERELGDLLTALEEARAGRGRAVLIGGEPGIGKSRLADEISSLASDLGCTVLWGRAWEDAGAPAYWPWIQVLRALVRTFDDEALARHVGLGAADLTQVLPELAMKLETHEVIGADPESGRFRLFDSTANLLRSAAASKPLLIVLDDLHAADTASVLLLRFLASQLSDVAALVVGTYRDLELTPDHPVALAIAEMARERATRLVMLGGLTSDAVSDYIASATNSEPDRLAVAAVWRETSGNPLFVGEAVRLLLAEGRLADVGDLTTLRFAVPAGVRAVIARRISHMSAAAGEALAVGAVIGPEFHVDVLRRAGTLDPTESASAVDEAAASGLLLAAGSPGRYRFSHDLVRETLYEQIPLQRRADLHRTIGEALEAVYGTANDAHLAELAFHFVHAAQLDTDTAPPDTRRKAIDYARQAGDQAARALAFEQTIELFTSALAVVDSDATFDSATRADMLIALGEAESNTGDPEKARISFLEAARIGRQIRSGHIFGRAALGYGGRHHWARAGADNQVITLLEEALALVDPGDEGLRVRLLTRLAGALRGSPDHRDECDRLTREAIELARGTGDDPTVGYALTGRFWATWWPENPAERQDLAREIVAVAARSADPELTANARLLRFLSLIELGRVSLAQRELDTLKSLLRANRYPEHLWLGAANRAMVALFKGEYDLASALIAEELGTGYRLTPARDDVSTARMQRFLLRRDQGRLGEEEATVRASVHEFPWYPLHRAALCVLLAEAGRSGEARTEFADLATNDFAAIFRDNEWLLGMALASQACSRLNDTANAKVLYEMLVPYAGRPAVGHAEGFFGMVDQYLGLLAGTLGRADDAVDHVERAVALLDDQGGRPWAARARQDLAALLRGRNKAGDEDRASRLEAEAFTIARDIGLALPGKDELGNGESPPPDAIPDLRDRALMQREGDHWAIEFGGDSFRLRDTKGLHHLTQLLARPGAEIHALDLVHSDMAGMGKVAREDELAEGDPSAAGAALDAEAKAAYRARLNELSADLAESEEWNDRERSSRLQAERDALIHELAAAVGLGGRDRNTSSSAERARVSVTRAIRTAIQHLNQYSPALGAHLDATIRTGTYCSYTPDPRAPISWELGAL